RQFPRHEHRRAGNVDYLRRNDPGEFSRRPVAGARDVANAQPPDERQTINRRLSMNNNETSRRKFCWQWLAVLPLMALAFGSISAATCEGLAELKLPNTTITSAQSVAAGAFTPSTGSGGSAAPYKELPAFCRVTGVIKPTNDSEIKFEVWLPSANWNGKFHGI